MIACVKCQVCARTKCPSVVTTRIMAHKSLPLLPCPTKYLAFVVRRSLDMRHVNRLFMYFKVGNRSIVPSS